MTHLEEELQKLFYQMNDMAGLVEGQIEKCITSLLEQDRGLAREVIFNEKRVNAYELKIDKDCENIFTLLNPFAHDMRFVFASLKINYNLERIGDNAEAIAHYALEMEKGFDKKLLEVCRFHEMAETVKLMLSASNRAYAERNAKLARTIFGMDSILDDINKSATTLIADYIRHNIDNVHQALFLLTFIRKLERVGDHVTNIAEEIIFFLEAKVLKHGKKANVLSKEGEE